MPEIVHYRAQTLDSQVSEALCGVVTLSWKMAEQSASVTCSRCLEAYQDRANEASEPPEPTIELTPKQVDGLNLLRAAIKASGLSKSAYAREILTRDPRTLRRWVAGSSPIPQAVLRFLTANPVT